MEFIESLSPHELKRHIRMLREAGFVSSTLQAFYKTNKGPTKGKAKEKYEKERDAVLAKKSHIAIDWMLVTLDKKMGGVMY